MTAEEMLAAYLNDAGETLMHFNKYHDPSTGQFTSKYGSLQPIKDKPGSFEEAKRKGLMAKSIRDFEQKKLDQRPKVRKKKLDLSTMTDQDLRSQIDRYLLEE